MLAWRLRCDDRPNWESLTCTALTRSRPDDVVQLPHHAVEVVHQIITGVQHMARVDGDAHVRLVIDAVDDGRQLLEVSPAFGALARHRLQQHHDARLQPEHAVEAVADQRASAIGALPHVRARMDVDVYLLPGLTDRRQQSDVLGERPYGELALVGILAGEVVDVGAWTTSEAVMLLPSTAERMRRPRTG